jgi:hypothetical protein
MSFCRDVAGVASAAGHIVEVVGSRELPWWGDAALLGEVIEDAMHLVRARTGSGATVVLEVQGDRDDVSLRIAGLGDPCAAVDPELVDRFRAAATRLGARVVPDALGPGGAGLVLALSTPTV